MANSENISKKSKPAERVLGAEREIEFSRLVGCRLSQASFAAFVDTEANSRGRRAAEEWLDNPETNLIVSGAVGTGKTYLAACLCRAFMERGCVTFDTLQNYKRRPRHSRQLEDLYWLSAPGWVASLKRGFRSEQDAARADEDLEFASKCDLLFLDDLGKVHPGQNGASWLEGVFYGLIDARYREGLITVVTSEWTRSALSDRVGASVVTRLMDGALIAPLDTFEWRKPLTGQGVTP